MAASTVIQEMVSICDMGVISLFISKCLGEIYLHKILRNEIKIVTYLTLLKGEC